MNFWIGKHNFNFIIHLLDQLQLRFVTELNTHFVQKFWLVCLSNKLFSKQIKNELYNYDEISNCGSREKWNAWESQRCVVGERKKTKLRNFAKKIKFWPDSEKQLCSGWPNFRSDSVSNFFSSNNRKTFFSFKILQSSWNYLTTLFSRLQIFHFSRKKCNFLNRLCGVKLLFPVLNLATRGGWNLSKNAKRVLGEIANRFFTYLEVELSG